MNKALLFLSCFLSVAADMMLVAWAKGSRSPWYLFAAAFVINAFGIAVWTYTMRMGIESATAITIYAVFTVAGCALLGHFQFGETLSTVNIIGVILGIVSLILVSL